MSILKIRLYLRHVLSFSPCSLSIIVLLIYNIPIAKINDVLLQQGFLQMIFGAGDILIQVGNDSGTLIKDVQNAKEFKEAIIMAINNLNHGSRRM